MHADQTGKHCLVSSSVFCSLNVSVFANSQCRVNITSCPPTYFSVSLNMTRCSSSQFVIIMTAKSPCREFF